MASSSSPSSFSSPALLLDQTGEGVSEVILHPLVFLSVLDHHTRRQEATGRVIGTLLGRRDGEKVRVCQKEKKDTASLSLFCRRRRQDTNVAFGCCLLST